MRKTLIWLLVLTLLLFASCAFGDEILIEDVPPPLTAEPEEYAQSDNAVFLVDNTLGEFYHTAALDFAERVEEFSGGELKIDIRLVASANPSGGADFIFLDRSHYAGMSSYLDAATTPFLYPDYKTFTMALNNERMLEAVREDLEWNRGFVPLGAFYQPGNHLLSNWQPSSRDSFIQRRIAVSPTSGTYESFVQLGADVENNDLEVRLERLRLGFVEAAEFTLAELYTADLSGLLEAEADYYLTYSYQTLDPVWLVGGAEFYQNLTPRQRAAVTEATAYLYADIDDRYLVQDEALREYFRQIGFLPYENLSDTRDALFGRGVYADESGADLEEGLSVEYEYVIGLVEQLL